MIVSLKGKLVSVGADWVHLELAGVTFQVFIPSSAIGGLGPLGGEISLFTHMRIRDEQPVLYGFPSLSSMELFQRLTAVSGVGPRLALALLSTLGAAGLRQAIAAGDVASLNSAPGVGQRTASRIVLDLKGKLDFDYDEGAPAAGGAEAEVIAALTALGYSTAEARRGLSGLSPVDGADVEELIRQALQRMSGAGG